MNWKILLTASLLAVLPLSAAALSVTVQTRTYVQTDAIKGQLDTDGVINSATGESNLNVQTVGDPATYAWVFAGAAANGGSAAVVSRSHSFGTVDSTGGVGLEDSINAHGEASAKVVIDDFVFSGPGGVINDAYLNLDVSGLLIGSALTITRSAFADSSSFFSMGAHFEGLANMQGSQGLRIEHYDASQPPEIRPSEVGDLVGVSFPEIISVGPFAVSTNGVYTIEFSIAVQTDTNLFGVGEGQSIGFADFGSTVSLSINGPVFTLPAGFSASSATANVVDNQWMGTPVSVVAPSVPLPPALGFLLAGLMSLRVFKLQGRSEAVGIQPV